ncbi:Peptide deformylase [hydrothermal vent metagenome]|uniref:Peptide deformylase n=1 Tax=hydrothermal vent metagenome TaxID=652676 RepID=A0A3B0V8Y0_9ZZZZ
MTKLNILILPDRRLKTIATPVEKFDNRLKTLVADMFATMYQAPGIGLAATQVDVHKQVVVIDVSEEKNQPLCLINPKITKKEGQQVQEEGCLSVPNIYAKVTRASTIEVAAQNETGETFTLQADELLAVCIQHELDHLKGIVFLDHLSPLKRKMALKKLEP